MNHEKVRILIVDDKPDKAMAIGSIVSELGEVVTAHSGKDALRCLMNQTFALILLDVNMPVMDGFETAELIRKRETSQHTPIIFITSFYDADVHKARAYTLGAVDYIMAPVVPEVLKAKVSVFVELYKKTEEVRQRAEERVQLMQEQMARVSVEAARAAAEEGERRAAFLAEASRLLTSALEYEATLQRVAELTVPEVSDYCAVTMVKDDAELQCLAVAHHDPAKVAFARTACDRYKPRADDPLPTVIRTGASVLISTITDELLQAAQLPADALEAIRAIGIRSYMIVPLRARERTLGALTFVTAESGRQLTQKDLALAEDLGRRAAIAIDNARLYNEAQQANRMKDDFLAVVSHELRTPLTPILGWTRMLRNDTFDKDSMSHALEIIERNARAQAKLIEDLLDVSRIITGKLRLNIRPIDLNSLLENSIDALSPAADAKNITIERKFNNEPIALNADVERMQQVVWNLLSNAIKFTPQGGKIQVSAARAQNNVTIEIHDTGRGISPKFLPFVFDRFRQADSSTTRAFGGLGIGLAIVRHLVELHGGTVAASSAGDGQGATFIVTLPELKSMKGVMRQDSGITARKTDAPVRCLEGLQILIVDDEPDTRDLLSKIFEQQGAQVVEAASAHEAMERLERCKPDLVVSDIGMAGLDGYNLIKRIRAQDGSYAKLPALALTAYARDEDKATALAAGFHAHMPKPIDPAALVLSVRGLMNRN